MTCSNACVLYSEHVDNETNLYNKSFMESLSIQTPAVNFSFTNDTVGCSHVKCVIQCIHTD